MLDEINVSLVSLLGYELSEQWWQKPNRHFDNKTPLEIWVMDPNRVYRYVCAQQ